MLQLILWLTVSAFAQDGPNCETLIQKYQKGVFAQAEEHFGKLELEEQGALKTQVDEFLAEQDLSQKSTLLVAIVEEDAFKDAIQEVSVEDKNLCGLWMDLKKENCLNVPGVKSLSHPKMPFATSDKKCESAGGSQEEVNEITTADNDTIDTTTPNSKQDSPTSSGSLIGVILSLLGLLGIGTVFVLGRKNMSKLDDKLNNAVSSVEKLNKKVGKLQLQLQEAEYKQQQTENKAAQLSKHIESLMRELKSLSPQTNPVQSQVEKVAEDNQSFENTDPLADMATTVHEKTKKSGFKLGGKKEKPTAGPVSKMVAAFDAFLKLWTDNEAILQNIPSYQRFQTRLIQNSAQFRSQLNIESFAAEEADTLIFPMLDLMVRFESELTHVSLQQAGRYNQEVELIHNIIYQGFGEELERNRIGKLKEVRPMFDTIDTSFQTVIDSRSVAQPFKGKIVEVWKVGVINMSGMKLLRRAEVISGG